MFYPIVIYLVFIFQMKRKNIICDRILLQFFWYLEIY